MFDTYSSTIDNMAKINKKTIGSSLKGFIFIAPADAQNDTETELRLDNFINKSCTTNYNQITSESVQNILKHDVFYITQETKNIYGEKEKEVHEFIVVDTGLEVKRFERIKTDTPLPELRSYIREDFMLNEESAPHFQTLLDYIYPIADWKPDKREFFFKNGKWYFLRDAYFRTKQGFEITVGPKGKITHICYKMRWDEYESK
ncbi:hypothetical protein LDL77_06320 [Flagellimonas marinaquae]|uniref:hypothetical protein n=1 Tax=Flagellimonas aurea TaxID=2915619 RepID=UPI001CE12829|nr:hypothetical protein LDL77_06320 [Allomuricauda aquimarina]